MKTCPSVTCCCPSLENPPVVEMGLSILGNRSNGVAVFDLAEGEGLSYVLNCLEDNSGLRMLAVEADGNIERFLLVPLLDKIGRSFDSDTTILIVSSAIS